MTPCCPASDSSQSCSRGCKALGHPKSLSPLKGSLGDDAGEKQQNVKNARFRVPDPHSLARRACGKPLGSVYYIVFGMEPEAFIINAGLFGQSIVHMLNVTRSNQMSHPEPGQNRHLGDRSVTASQGDLTHSQQEHGANHMYEND